MAYLLLTVVTIIASLLVYDLMVEVEEYQKIFNKEYIRWQNLEK